MGSKVEFTKHALERMDERGASRVFVEAVVTGNVKTISFPSSKDEKLILSTAKDKQGKYWTVIYSENRVITAHRAHKPEEKRYEEEFGTKKGS